jgi:hypothetical protein
VNIRVVFSAVTVGLCACQNMPEPYAPPAQRPVFAETRPRSERMVNMGDPDAPRRFVQDIFLGEAEAGWRWTNQRPTVKVLVSPSEPLKYAIDFTVPEVTFKDTGPVTLSFYVNDHLLDRVEYTSHGSKHFEKPVPPDWLTPAEQTLAAEIDKVWMAKEDGSKLGFILVRIGLKR